MHNVYLFTEDTITDLINQDGLFDNQVTSIALNVLRCMSGEYDVINGFDSLVTYHTRGFQRELFDYDEALPGGYSSMYVEVTQGYNSEGYCFDIVRDYNAPLFDEELLSTIGVEVGFNDELYDLVSLALELLIKKVLMLLHMNVSGPVTGHGVSTHSFNFEVVVYNKVLHIKSVFVNDI